MIKYLPTSKKYKIPTQYFNDRESVLNWFSWADDLVIEEVQKTKAEWIFIENECPQEFWSALSYYAYEKGHSAGEEEINNILAGLVFDLMPSIKAFEKRIRG